jgi:purine-binding chemotaxis protein CheW
VRGLVNLRGAIVTVIDLGARLAGGSASEDGSVVLAEFGNKNVGLAVDEVRDVQIMPSERFEPATGDLARGGIVRGLGHLDSGVVIVLEVPAVIRQVMA